MSVGPPAFFDESLWVSVDDEIWHLIGSTYTHPGHVQAWSQSTGDFRTLTRPEMTSMSDESRYWLEGLLAGGGKPAPDSDDPAVIQAWRDARDEFRRLGRWPRRFSLWGTQDRIDAAAKLEPIPLVALAVAEFGLLGPAAGILEARIRDERFWFPEMAVLSVWTAEQRFEAIGLATEEIRAHAHHFDLGLIHALAQFEHLQLSDPLQLVASLALSPLQNDEVRMRQVLLLLIERGEVGWGESLDNIWASRANLSTESLELLEQFDRPMS